MTSPTLTVEPWELYPMPAEEKAAIRRYIQRMTGPAVWRVQWYSRSSLDADEVSQGRHNFTSEDKARAYLALDEVQSRVGPYWRAELQCCGPWVTVERGEYTEEDR